jgi:hypothetical protein
MPIMTMGEALYKNLKNHMSSKIGPFQFKNKTKMDYLERGIVPR